MSMNLWKIEQLCKENFALGAASRDAEVAELKNQLADNNLFDSDRNQWRNNYRRTISDLTKERDQLRKQVTLLRDALEVFAKLYFKEAIEALAATADLDKFVLCESDPFGIWHAGDTDEESDFFIFSEAGDVSENCTRCTKLYRAKEQWK